MKVFSEELVEEARVASRVADLSQATIGEVLLVAQYYQEVRRTYSCMNRLHSSKVPYRMKCKCVSIREKARMTTL